MGRWVPKTPTEIRRDTFRRRLSPRIPLVLTGMLFLGLCLMDLFGFRKSGPPQPEKSLRDVLAEVPFLVVLAFLVGFPAGYLLQFLHPYREMLNGPASFHCERCRRLQAAGDGDICQCGGEWIDPRKMKWVEDEPTERS